MGFVGGTGWGVKTRDKEAGKSKRSHFMVEVFWKCMPPVLYEAVGGSHVFETGNCVCSSGESSNCPLQNF